MRKPSPSSNYVIAALVAAALGLTAGPALAQTTTSQGNQSQAPASHRYASKKSVRNLTSQVKSEREQMQESTGKLNRATAQLKRTTRQMKQAQSREMRVASAERHVTKGERTARSRVHSRHTRTTHRAHPANTAPPQSQP